jgi:hydrogenase-1 operon protein HyaF
MTASCAAASLAPAEESGFVEALLREALAHLVHFAQTGETAAIDLGGLPISGRDREALDEALGRGETFATLDVLGRSEIWETQYSGVWRVRHFGDASVAADLIEITACPKILFADRRDADFAARRLAKTFEQHNAIAETSHET